MRRRVVAGNWKMNGNVPMARALAAAVAAEAGSVDAEVVLCPPFPLLGAVAAAVAGSPVALGAQNVHPEASGAFTGEVSVAMLAESGCSHVIVGHSERRALLGEDDAFVAAKVASVLSAGLHPVLCVGETLEEREAGATEAVVSRQLRAVLELVGSSLMPTGVVAYEPVWAIGTGRTASPEQAQAVHAFLRGLLGEISAETAAATRILYGGSVKPDNAAELFAMPDIDGGLIGGASLDATAFLAICKAKGL